MLTQGYEEIIQGETLWRPPPDQHHEMICERLHANLAPFDNSPASYRLPPRSIVELSAGTFLRPDLALLTAHTRKLWLAAEVVNSHDHSLDTVTKKAIYEEVNLPRLWMVDPRYDNVEVYHGSAYGLVLKRILANREILTDLLLPGFALMVMEIFCDAER
jgi:Uma2 family endonuclease